MWVVCCGVLWRLGKIVCAGHAAGHAGATLVCATMRGSLGVGMGIECAMKIRVAGVCFLVQSVRVNRPCIESVWHRALA